VDPLLGHAVVSTGGGKRLNSMKVQRFDAETGRLSGEARLVPIDCLAVSGGWSPAIHLASQAGAAPKWDSRLQAFLPPEPAQNWVGAGAFTGAFTTQEAIVEGLSAGAAAAGAKPSRARPPQVDAPDLDVAPAPVFRIKAEGKAFVDL